ncbi:MAG: T9SS type A sorting domain-containing protein [Lewinellaceae bacterium]|nr:T9SS type A sorting domain-containing protein [Lewinellaceae bacterium]
MKKLHSLLLVLALVLVHSLNLSAQTLNDDGSTHTINANGSTQHQGAAQDYTIPSNTTYNTLSFTLRGGDGGYAKAGADCQSNGGEGATTEAVFWIGNGINELRPGGTVRFIVGKHGVNGSTGGTDGIGGGGGGGTTVLYRFSTGHNWAILAVAGGGGGAYQGNVFGGCVDSQKGQGGRSTESGGSGEGANSGSGGTNGNGGGGGGGSNGGGGGGGANSSGDDGGNTGGGKGLPNGGAGGNTTQHGGWGFGGGGGGGISGGGGGGGGYSGGGGGATANNGGGGGSYAYSAVAISSNRTEGSLGGGNSQNGFVTYTFENTIITWTGAVDHNWHDSGNWSPTQVPTSSDIVEINAAVNDPYIWPGSPAEARFVRVLNGGELTIEPNATLNLSPRYSNGISNNGMITNDNGEINISPVGYSTYTGILNYDNATFINKFGGIINIVGMDGNGIFNNSNSTFTNQLGGTINIGTVSDPIGENGIQNEAGCTFSNFGTLNIKKANLIGIQNAGSFSNYLGGLIDLKNAGTRGIHCEANTFTNNGGINIGNGDTIGQDGIYLNSSASFINNTSGTVLIWGTGKLGILVEDNGTIDNFGTISIGGLGGTGTLGVAAIGNLGFLNNKPGGAISINQTTNAGILNGSAGLLSEFNNEGDITIGATSGTGDDAIQNQGIFDNFSTGTIDIVQSGRNGLRNTGNGSFTNEGLIKIGENGSITDAAIRNEAPFLNSSCSAVIHLFEKNIADTYNSFTNSGTILKESTGSSDIETNNGVILYNAGTFTADNGNAPVSVTGSFSGKKIWTGCDGNAWEGAENWYPAGIPTASDDVVIYPVATDPLISTSVQTKSVQVAGGHLINNGALAVTDGDLDINLGATVEGNGQYDISGHFTVNGGTFTAGTSTVTMTGTIDDRAIGFDPVTFYNLVIDKPADKAVRIFSIVSVTNEMIINSGDLEVVGVLGGALTCPYLHLPNGTDLFNFDGGNIFVTESANSFLIQSGASVQGNGFYYIKGDFIVDGGTFTPGTSAVILNGTGNQTISFDPTNFYTLIINKLSGITSLGSGSVTVSNLLNLNHGKLNLNGSDIELIGNGTITGENALNYIYSTNGGVVKKTVDLNAPAAENPGNIGASITSSANLGTTTIQRGHDVQDVNGEVSIKRYYDIAPANNSGLDATVRFSYLGHELNGIAEPDLRPYRFNGTDWNIYLASASDVSANWVETQNVDAFSTWTLAADCGATTLYADVDGDGYGDPTVTIFDCLGLSGYVADNTDCNDGDANVNPNPDCSTTTRTWTGHISTDWDEPCNWSPNCVPTANDDVVIPDATNDPVIFATTTALTKSVTIETGAQLTINNQGSLSIDGSTNEGLYNLGAVYNFGTIQIGHTIATSDYGIYSKGPITNDGGIISVKNAENPAIRMDLNNASLSNLNGGEINIGQDGGYINDNGLVLLNSGDFLNNNGIIRIDNVFGAAFSAYQSTVENSNGGQILIGQSDGNIEGPGIYLLSSATTHFTNDAGIVRVDAFNYTGLYLEASVSFFNTNGGQVALGENSTGGTTLLIKSSNSLLTNGACSEISIVGKIENNGTFINSGLLNVDHSGAHINTSDFTNHGIISYPQGNPIPNVTNEEIIVELTTTTDCSSVSPAFGLGAPVDFNILGIFTDENATQSAGTYDVNTNTFTPANNLPTGATVFYVKIEDPVGGCTRIVEWEVNSTGTLVTCYLDSDSDTYGDPAMAQTFCETCGTGYVLDNTDCDDDDENEFPGQIWYEDADSDGYTTGNTQTACERPLGYRPASELVNTTDIDCDDSDPNVNSCSGLTISGSIIWEHDGVSGVNNATVNVTGAGNGSDASDTNGDYEVNIPSGTGNFTVKPAKNINKLNGATSADVMAIQKHVTNIVLLPAPFKRIAADVNKSNSITTFDASLLNQALLGNPAALNLITSWRFVADDYVFPNPNIPWGFPEQINLTGVTGNTSGHDFKGIKLGDVVSTWSNPANFSAGEPLVLQVQDRILQTGQELDVEFRADQLDDLNSFQFALYFNPVQLMLVEIEPLKGLPVSMDNFGTYNVAAGEIRMLWSQANPVMLSEAAPIFRLRFQVLESGALLSDVLQLDEATLPAHAYNSAYKESDVQLRFLETSATTDPDEATLRLEAWPNPFSESTVLQFSLPRPGEAEIRVHDQTGQVIFSKKAYYAAGAHNERLDLAGNATGMYMVELRSAAGRAVLPLVRADK